MQIISIELQGLWSYRDPQRIELSGLPFVVGVGANGTGKSAILVHAVLVAFYDKFPSSTKEGSITRGSAQGSVSVEMEIGGAVYRVHRVYTRDGKPSAKVLVADPSKPNGWRSVASGVQNTTTYVTALIGMDYDTATMTWIAEQGDYGKFCRALPAKRFQLLSGITGLDLYAPKAKAAHDAWKKADTNVTRLDGRIEELSDALTIDADGDAVSGLGTLGDPELTALIVEADADIDRINEALAELNAGDPARKSVEARQALELVRNQRLNRLDAATRAHSRATTDLATAENRGRAQRAAADDRLASAVATAEKRAADQRASSAAARRDALAALTLITTTQRDLPNLADTVTGYREAASASQAEAQAWREHAATAQVKHTKLRAEYDSLKTRIEDAAQRIAMLRRSTSDTEHADCFSCGQHLTKDDALALIASQERDIEAARARQAAIKVDGAAATSAKEAAELAATAHLREAAEHDQKATEAIIAVTKAEALIATKDERVRQEADAVKVSGEAASIESAARKAAAVDHTTSITAIDNEEKTAVATAQQELAQSATVIAENTEQLPLETNLEAAVIAAEALVADAVAQVQEQRSALDVERATARQKVRDLSAERARRAELASLRADQLDRLTATQSERKDADAQRSLYQALDKAFSPGGIPAMVLAGMIDELNEAINVPLNRLSNGELSVLLRTSRETASGTVENKVSIQVETGDGPSDYSLLSGGQKFRVDIAIRIGLAAAVARGTGTPISTFILDEGWGTLDGAGIQQTIDTLFRLSEQMNVLTVSHIEAVKDAFPSRVEVTMVGRNSVASVITD